MHINIFWTGLEYNSRENCFISSNSEGSEIHSTIVSGFKTKMYTLDYSIKTNANWETMYAEVFCRYNNKQQHIVLEGDGKGSWIMNGKKADHFKGCIDIDIPLTPFTNSLPINRLRLAEGEEQIIQVIYLDVLEGKVVAVKQKYKCVAMSTYHYENVPNDFEADIKVDKDGFVVDYPSLFFRM